MVEVQRQRHLGAVPGRPLHWRVRKLPGGASLVGEIDIAAAPDVVARCTGMLADVTTRFVMDLHEVTFLDSHGAEAVLEIADAASDRGITLEVRAPSHEARLVLDLLDAGALLDPEDGQP
jgi:anti-anti-sigma factor